MCCQSSKGMATSRATLRASVVHVCIWAVLMSSAQVLQASLHTVEQNVREARNAYMDEKKSPALLQEDVSQTVEVSDQAHGRRLQQTATELLDTTLYSNVQSIATRPGNEGFLTEQQKTNLLAEYIAAFNDAGISFDTIPCGSGWLARSGSLFNVIMQGCNDTTIYVRKNTSLTIQNAIFFNNSQVPVFVYGCNLVIVNAVFLSNYAVDASGIYAAQQHTVLAAGLVMHGNAQRMLDDAFPDHRLSGDQCFCGEVDQSDMFLSPFIVKLLGGAMRVWGREFAETNSSTIYNHVNLANIERCTFLHNKAYYSGGAIDTYALNSLKVFDSVFKNNMVDTSQWAGVSVTIGGSLYIDSDKSILKNNLWEGSTALSAGGAVFASCPQMEVNGDVFVNNTVLAGKGGAFGFNGKELHLLSTAFNNNSVDGHGGALYCSNTDLTDIQSCLFSSNQAGSGGAATIEAKVLTVVRTVFEENGAATYQPAATSCSGSDMGAGGAVCVNMIQDQSADSFEYVDKKQRATFVNCTFSKNVATNGGAVHYAVPCSSPEDACFPLKLRGSDTVFSDNVAYGGSGNIAWAQKAGLIKFSTCIDQFDYDVGWPSDDESMITGHICNSWVQNTFATSSTDFGSLASALNTQSETGSAVTLLSDLVSSSTSPHSIDIQVLINDGFGHVIMSGSSEANTTVIASISPSTGTFIGSPGVPAQSGMADFSSLAIKGKPGNYTITFGKSVTNLMGTIAKTSVNATIRRCSVGEVSPSQEECNACRDTNLFSFNPYNASCDSCPTNAICGYPGKSAERPPVGPIGAILVPKIGYWQSSPRSSQIHLCPHAAACGGKFASNRTTDLTDYQKYLINSRLSPEGIRGWPVLQQDVDEYNLLQCQEGHYGNVCGGCLEGFGRRSEGECVKCPPRTINNMAFFFAVLIRLGMVAMMIGSLMDFSKDVVSDDHVDSTVDKSDLPAVISTKIDSWADKKSTSNAQNDDVEQAIDKAASLVDSDSKGKTLEMARSNMTIQQHLERTFSSQSTSIKILVTYLQIASIIRNVTLELPAPVLKLLAGCGMISNGIKSAISLDCSLPDSTLPKSIQATILTVALPFIIAASTVPFWMMYWSFAHRNKEGGQPFGVFMRSRLRVTGVALAFYFYPDLVDSLLSIFSCKQLDTPVHAQAGDLPNDGTILTAVGQWWTSDYTVQCYKGQHLVLMLALGIPGVLLICIGLPLWSTLFLRSNKKRHNHTQFLASYALMYSDYEEQWYYWESVVMLRKFVLVVLAVAIDSNYPTLKLLACLVWIEASTIAVVMAKPYRLERMDSLDSLSHWGTAFTLLLALLFINTPSDNLKVFALIAILASNIYIMAYMAIQVFKETLFTMMMYLDSNATGTLYKTDLVSQPEYSLGKKFKIWFVSGILDILTRLPSRVAQFFVLYPCQHVDDMVFPIKHHSPNAVFPSDYKTATNTAGKQVGKVSFGDTTDIEDHTEEDNDMFQITTKTSA